MGVFSFLDNMFGENDKPSGHRFVDELEAEATKLRAKKNRSKSDNRRLEEIPGHIEYVKKSYPGEFGRPVPHVPKHDRFLQMDRADRVARMRGFTAVGGRKTRKGRKGKKSTRRR
jgi:hypothetical protein